MLKIGDLTITSLETITAFDIVTGDYLFTLDELKGTTIEQSQEKTDITGKQGRKLSSLKRNKAVTINGTNGMVSGGLLELQTGSDFDSNVTDIMWTDYLVVSSNTATTTFKAIGTSGAEIVDLYEKNSDGTLGSRYEQDSATGAGKFTYNPATKTITFANGAITDGNEIVVYYKRKIKADGFLKDASDTYSKKCALYIEAVGEDKCAKEYRVQFYVPKADFDGNFSIEMGDNQTDHAFSAEALSGACGTRGEFFTYTVFGADAQDEPTLSSIAVTTAPTKTTYDAGEQFNVSGMVVTATYSDATTKTVTGYTVSPAGFLTAEDEAVTVSYTEGGVTKTATQAITVTAA